MPRKRQDGPSDTQIKSHSKIQTGSISEATVARHLTTKGWVVYTMIFRNAGPIDLIAMHPPTRTWLFIDVKTETTRSLKPGLKEQRIYRVRTKLQKKLGVVLAYTDAESGKIIWRPELSSKIARLV
jgi:Holliday junction resolvase-like predicted endonuclease